MLHRQATRARTRTEAALPTPQLPTPQPQEPGFPHLGGAHTELELPVPVEVITPADKDLSQGNASSAHDEVAIFEPTQAEKKAMDAARASKKCG